MKKKDGRAARNGTFSVAIYFVTAQVVLVLLYFVNSSGSRIAQRDGERNVLEAKYFLIDIDVPVSAVSRRNNHESYHGVTGVFCPLDWQLQKQRPSNVSMFRSLIAASTHCRQRHRIDLDLGEVVKQARHYDLHSPLAPQELQFAGIVFHETRCGSTLTANLLSAADPSAHRVYSEASPLLTAMQACSISTCDENKANELLRDVLYLMGRSSDPREKRVFYKVHSLEVRNMANLVKVVHVPWIFIYRNSLEVMMSHFKDATIRKRALCLRERNQPHPLENEIAESHNRKVSSLSDAEYCAVHLASLCEAAIRGQSDLGLYINYADLPDIVWDTILPDHFGVSSPHIEGMKKAAVIYSKTRGANAFKEWEEDSARKQSNASDVIRQAAIEFLNPSFDKLEALSREYR